MTAAGEASVRAVRAFVRERGRTPVGAVDRYVSVFGAVMLAAVLGQPLASLIEGMAGPVDPGRVGAGASLLLLAFAGWLAAARAAGPVMLPAADASWLLLSPLNRRHLLGRTGRVLAVVAVTGGLLLGVGLLALLGAPDQLVWRLLGALALGVSAGVAGTALAVLSQASQSWHVWLTCTLVALLVLAVVAVSGQARTALTAAAAAPLPAIAAAVAATAALAAFLARRAWTALATIPTRVLLTVSTRAGHVADAALVLDPGALTWIAEDNHWRARKLASRRWPQGLAGPFALAWHDWLRAVRRPGRLVATFACAALPAVFAQAGGAPAALSAVVLAGGLAVAATFTSGARRDADNPALARLTGVNHRQALATRAILPALAAALWTALALAGITAASGSVVAGATAGGGLGAGMWWLFGPVAAPALAAAALRMARRGPVDHSMPVLDTPGGPVPTGPLFWAAKGADVALIGCVPTLLALTVQPARPGAFLAAQAVLSALTLGAFVLKARATGRG